MSAKSKQIRSAIIIAILFVAIVECMSPSATDYASVAKNFQVEPDGIEATRWTDKSGATVYECWWFIGCRDAVYLITNPPAELANSAGQMSWLQSALCDNRVWIPIAGATLGLLFIVLGMTLNPRAWENNNRQCSRVGKSRTPRQVR